MGSEWLSDHVKPAELISREGFYTKLKTAHGGHPSGIMTGEFLRQRAGLSDAEVAHARKSNWLVDSDGGHELHPSFVTAKGGGSWMDSHTKSIPERNPFRPQWPPVEVKSCGPAGADPCDPLEFSRGAYHASKMVETFTPQWIYKQIVVGDTEAAGLPYECCKDENRPDHHDRAAAMHTEISTMVRNGHLSLPPDVLAMHDTAAKLHRMASAAGRGVSQPGS